MWPCGMNENGQIAISAHPHPAIASRLGFVSPSRPDHVQLTILRTNAMHALGASTFIGCFYCEGLLYK